MPTRNVNLTDELDHFVLQKVESGRYENASEVVRAALRTLEREEQRHEAKLAALRTAIDEGDASGIAEGNVFERVREKLNLPSFDGALACGQVPFSHRAEADLFNIGLNTFRTWGEIQTERYIRQLEDCCQLLADNPALGRPWDEIRPGLRRMKQGKHVVFYREELGDILISRILPEKQTFDDEDDTPDSL